MTEHLNFDFFFLIISIFHDEDISNFDLQCIFLCYIITIIPVRSPVRSRNALIRNKFFFIILFSIDKSISRFTNRHISSQTCNKSMYISQRVGIRNKLPLHCSLASRTLASHRTHMAHPTEPIIPWAGSFIIWPPPCFRQTQFWPVGSRLWRRRTQAKEVHR